LAWTAANSAAAADTTVAPAMIQSVNSIDRPPKLLRPGPEAGYAARRRTGHVALLVPARMRGSARGCGGDVTCRQVPGRGTASSTN
jgi:hypothetical protein